MQCLLLKQEIKNDINITPADWASKFEENMQSDFEALRRAAMPDKMSAEQVSEILNMATERLELGGERLLPRGDPNVKELMERHLKGLLEEVGCHPSQQHCSPKIWPCQSWGGTLD
jgi:hypothetical protein